jgi:hypothetical protein
MFALYNILQGVVGGLIYLKFKSRMPGQINTAS